MHVLFSALRRLKQEDHHEFNTSPGYTVSSRLALATELDPVQNNQDKGGRREEKKRVKDEKRRREKDKGEDSEEEGGKAGRKGRAKASQTERTEIANAERRSGVLERTRVPEPQSRVCRPALSCMIRET